jgi:hypothetical protein
VDAIPVLWPMAGGCTDSVTASRQSMTEHFAYNFAYNQVKN